MHCIMGEQIYYIHMEVNLLDVCALHMGTFRHKFERTCLSVH